jgi:transposase
VAKVLLPDELWKLIEPLLPASPLRPKGGRPRVPDRAVLTGILLVLMSGIPWQYLPQEMGCGSGMTCWRRLHAWQQAGVWEKVHRLLLRKLREADRIDWSRAVVDSSSIRAVGGGRKDGPQSDRSAPPGHEASCSHGWSGHPSGLHRHGGEHA